MLAKERKSALEYCKYLTVNDLKNDKKIKIDWKVRLMNFLMSTFG